MRTLIVGLSACAALMLGTGCANAPQSGVAEAPRQSVAPAREPPPQELAQLEDLFWTCDYVATIRGIDATPIPQCTAATRELRRVRFDGSFQRMLAWWRENKPAEHDRIRAQRGDPQ